MDSSDVTKKKMGRFLASIQQNPSTVILYGQVPNNPPLTPDNLTFIKQQYPQSEFANTNNLYPCSTILCSTIYPVGQYMNFSNYYYNTTN
jgi:hypothetical protein